MEKMKHIGKEARRKKKENFAWWIKWTSSVAILGAMSIRSAGVLPTADLVLSFIGVFGWTLVGLLWKDRAIIVLNAAGLTILAIGLLKVAFG
tara:strand:- start:10577 stop:10852 length:276 start_codon:yes stop_codon:yes gene_type:complete